MKPNVVLKFLILAIIVCIIISAWAAAWTASMSIVWNKVLFPTARCCTRMTKAWIQVSSNPSNYQLREPYDSLDVLRHPYFHDSLHLTLIERYILVTSKHAGLFVLCYVTVQVLQCFTMALGTRWTVSPPTENVDMVNCTGGGVPHGFVFWVSIFFRPTFPLLRYHPSGSSKKETIWSHNYHPSEIRIEYKAIFWFSNFGPTFLPSIWNSYDCAKTMPSLMHPHPPRHTAKDIAPSPDTDSVFPMLEEVDPFKSPLVNEKFCPLATSSLRNSPMHGNTPGSHDFDAVLEADGSMESNGSYNVANGPGFLGDEGSMDTWVHLLGDRSPAPTGFLASANVKHNVRAGAISIKGTSSTPTPLFCSTILRALVKNSASTAVVPCSSLGPASPDSSPLVSGPYISFPQPSNSNGQATDKNKSCDCSTVTGTKEIPPDVIIADIRTERGVQRISRDAVFGILKCGPRPHIRSLSRAKVPECTPQEMSAVPTEAIHTARHTSTVAAAEASASACALRASRLNSAKDKSSFSSLPSTDRAGVVALTETVYIRSKVVGKTRLFEDAYKRATAGLRPEKRQHREFVL